MTFQQYDFKQSLPVIEGSRARMHLPKGVMPENFDHEVERVNVVPFYEFMDGAVTSKTRFLGFGCFVGFSGVGMVILSVNPLITQTPGLLVAGLGGIGVMTGVSIAQWNVREKVTEYIDSYRVSRFERDSSTYREIDETGATVDMSLFSGIDSAGHKVPLKISEKERFHWLRLSQQGKMMMGDEFSRDKHLKEGFKAYAARYGGIWQALEKMGVIVKSGQQKIITKRGEYFFANAASPTVSENMAQIAPVTDDDGIDGLFRGH